MGEVEAEAVQDVEQQLPHPIHFALLVFRLVGCDDKLRELTDIDHCVCDLGWHHTDPVQQDRYCFEVEG